MQTLAPLLNAAIARYGAGKPAEAAGLLRTVLAIVPVLPDGLRLMGVCVSAQGDHRTALRLIGRAVRVAGPLGGAFLPSLAVALTNMAVVLAGEGCGADALAACRTALAAEPAHRDAHANLAALGGTVLGNGGAAVSWSRAARLLPERGESWKALGGTLLAAHRPAEAAAALRRAAALMPTDSEVLLLLGNTALAALDYGRAADCYGRSHRLVHGHGALSNLGMARVYQGRAGEAVAAAQRSAALRPDLGEIWVNVASVLVNCGEAEEALRLTRRALRLRPDRPDGLSNLLIGLQYGDNRSPLEVFAEHRRFDALVGRPRAAHHARHGNDPDPDRPLRVGYVSNDFRQHVASCFFEPLLACHDPARVEAFCYSDTVSPDAVTRRLTALTSGWRDTFGLSEAELAQRIRDDRIDILVDLGGHSAGNRLTVFARRPAPIQVTWLAYPDTTGLSAMDYRLVDAITDPEGIADGLASETLVRLPDGFLCYWPPHGAPEPGPSPAAAGPVTFGSFNRMAKVTPAVVALWAAVLRRVPESRLLMKSIGIGSPAVRGRIEAQLRDHGVDPARLETVSWSPTWLEHLALYRRIDIALDCFPYNGTTTSCEALWMGVPMIGLLGDRHAARVGASLMSRIGLSELVARDAADYVEIAARLASDRERLASLRAGMRDRLRASPLCDGPGFARRIEDAYRGMWRRWSAARAASDCPG